MLAYSGGMNTFISILNMRRIRKQQVSCHSVPPENTAGLQAHPTPPIVLGS
jgi:hypothetical protein